MRQLESLRRYVWFHDLCTTFVVRSILGIFLVAGSAGCGSGEDALGDMAAEGGTKTLSWTAVPDPCVGIQVLLENLVPPALDSCFQWVNRLC